MTGLRARQKEKRREMIEHAAGLLFESKGFSVSTIEEVADAALVSPATVYNYYGNKGELLLALVSKGETATREKLHEFVGRAQEEEPEDLLSEIICFNVQDTLKFLSRELWGHVVAYVATTSDPSVAPRYLSAIADDLAAALAATIKEYCNLDILKDIDAEHLAYVLTRIERNQFLNYVYLRDMPLEDLLTGIKKDVSMLIGAIRK